MSPHHAPGCLRWILVLLLLAVPAGAGGQARQRLLDQAEANPRLELTARRHQPSDSWYLSGHYRVFEDREAREGRELELKLVVLPATGSDRAPDPVFVFHGGPGAAATAYLSSMASSWIRERRDIVLIDQRGTGGSNPLVVELPGSEDDLQGYLEPIFDVEVFRAALPRLQGIADLTKYTTPIAMDDANEVREALGYETINLRGGSYGSRAVLVFLRRHPETARTAIVNGVAPASFVNPLYHAEAAQEGLETIFREVRSDPEYREAFPNLKGKFKAILKRLEQEPAVVEVPHPVTGEATEVQLSREAFTEALRVLMYYTPTNRQVPMLLESAYQGNYTPFAVRGMASNRSIRRILCFGMLMCVTGSEDLPRIVPRTIPGVTKDTFLGDGRVRGQLAVGEIWPRGDVPADYAEPVSVDVPVLLWSGTHDPVTPPRWGGEAANHLPNSLHLVVPGAHGVSGPQVGAVERRFLEAGSLEGIGPADVESLRMPRFVLPAKD